MAVRIQTADFDTGEELKAFRLARKDAGAVVSFIGQVRDLNEGDTVATLTLEHYPGMTESALEAIVSQAKARWNIMDALVIHRVGTLQPLDQIVLVAVSSAHRGEAFSACEFIMDYLKTEAPFWKKEKVTMNAEGADKGKTTERWLDAKGTDDAARDRWQTK